MELPFSRIKSILLEFLHLVLYAAERAWSHAMEKKTLPDGPNARQRSYLIGRLRKAVKWADLFAQLCAKKGDSRTSLEAEVYASYMKGNLLFEQDKKWDTALKSLKNARAVYEELGKYGDLENQVLCCERVEEIEPKYTVLPAQNCSGIGERSSWSNCRISFSRKKTQHV